MPSFPCSVDDSFGHVSLEPNSLRIINSKFSKEYKYSALRSIHVKNADVFLLKIRFDEGTLIQPKLSSFVCTFESMALRDFLKALLLSLIIPADSINKQAFEQNAEYRRVYTHVSPLLGKLDASKLLNASNKLPGTFLDQELYHQQVSAPLNSSLLRQLGKSSSLVSDSKSTQMGGPKREINLVSAFPQPLIDTFISMNCSLNQFVNLILNSYFYDPKNKKNMLDRILSDKIRGFTVEMDWATRINSAGFMAVKKQIRNEERVRETKVEAEPAPALALTVVSDHENTTNNGQIQLSGLDVDFNYTFKPGIIKNIKSIDLISRDFEVAREMCRIAYCGEVPDKIDEFSKEFINMVVGKYGDEALPVIARLVPSYYKTTK